MMYHEIALQEFLAITYYNFFIFTIFLWSYYSYDGTLMKLKDFSTRTNKYLKLYLITTFHLLFFILQKFFLVQISILKVIQLDKIYLF